MEIAKQESKKSRRAGEHESGRIGEQASKIAKEQDSRRVR